jgi:1-acyl-sn-glycerol-3-phosphate acyltransferase
MRPADTGAAAPPSRFIRWLHAFMTPFARVEVSGLHNLDAAPGLVVVCNHVGWADPLWVGYAAFPRLLHQMAKKELFDIPLVAWFVRSGGGFPVDRGRPTPATIKHAIALVESGQRLLIFPAGTRGQEDVDSKRGAATIALRAGAPIVPACFQGPAGLRLSHLWRRPTIRVVFGTPIVAPEDGASGKATALRVTAELDAAMKAIRLTNSDAA